MSNIIIGKKLEIGPETKMERNKSWISKTHTCESSWYNWIKNKKIKLLKTAGLNLGRY